MKKTLKSLVFGSLTAAILVAGLTANAQPTKAKDTTDTPKPKRDWYPFYGTVASVDKSAKTVSLKKVDGVRVLQTDDKTTLEMNSKPATLADIKVGNYLHGKLHKEGGTTEYILDAKIEKEAPPQHRNNSHVEKEKTAVTPAAPEDTSTNAPVKKKKKTTTTNQ